MLIEFNACVCDADLFFLIKFSSGHFERLFAHSEEGVDRFGVGLVVVGEAAFVFVEQAEDFGGGVFDAGIAGAVGGHVDLGLAGG